MQTLLFIEELVELVESYRSRTFDEDITKLKEEYGGEEGLASRIKSNISDGILGDDLELRDSVYGTNRKDPPTRSSF